MGLKADLGIQPSGKGGGRKRTLKRRKCVGAWGSRDRLKHNQYWLSVCILINSMWSNCINTLKRVKAMSVDIFINFIGCFDFFKVP